MDPEDLLDRLVQSAVVALSRPEVLMHPRVQQLVKRAGRYTTAQVAQRINMDPRTFARLYQRKKKLRCLGIPLDENGVELPPERADAAKEYLWDLPLVEWYLRVRPPEDEDDEAPA